MTKLREPLSFPDAVTRICGALTPAAAAAAVGKSKSLLRMWADPDTENLPNVAQAAALDAAYVKGGHGEPPLAAAYGAELLRLDGGICSERREPPQERLQQVIKELGDVIGAIGGKRHARLSEAERIKAKREALDLVAEAEALVGDLGVGRP